jgi:hypothetical protein
MLFDLRSIPDDKNRPRVFLIQLPLKPKEARIPPVDMPVSMAYIEGTELKAVRPALEKILGGVDKTDEFLASDVAVKVKETDGVRLLVLFLTLSGAKNPDKLAQSAVAVMGMELGDAEFWAGKLRNLAGLPAEKAERIRTSFLTMLGN